MENITMQELLDIEPKARALAKHRPLSIKAVVVTNDSKILLLKRPGVDGRWDLPGGGVDEGENFSEAFSREIYEETGLTACNARPLYTFLRQIKDKPEKLLQFVLSRVDVNADKLDITLSDEHESHRFFDQNEISDISMVASYMEALRRGLDEMGSSLEPYKEQTG